MDATMNGKYLRGFTLLEVLFVLAILVITLRMAAPSFQQFTRENRQVTQSNDFLASLRYACNQSVTKRRYVTLLCQHRQQQLQQQSMGTWLDRLSG